MVAGINEVAEGREFLYAKLSGDATLNGYLGAPSGCIWDEMAPPGTPTPFVIIGHQSDTDTLTATAIRIMARMYFQVKAVGPVTQAAAIRNAANRIDVLLARTSGTSTTGIILACWRDGALDIPELVDGALWRNLGGMYRLEVT